MSEIEDRAARRAAIAFAYENARPEVQALVPRSARRILDLGCSSGALAAALKARQEAEVVGVEIDEQYAADAGRRLDRVVVSDVEELADREDLEEDLGRFDCLVAADVLEHLRDPWTALRRFAGLLEPGGHAVISLPNVRYWDTFRQLGVHGRWPRWESGIFDATHLRWFTGKDAHMLLDAAGLELEQVCRQYRFAPGGTRFDRYAELFERLPPLRPFFAYQYVLLARRP